MPNDDRLWLDLAPHHVGERGEALVLDLLDEAPEVAPVAARLLQVDDRRRGQRDQRRAEEHHDRPQSHVQTEQQRDREPVRRHHRQHAAHVGTPERGAVGEQRDHEHDDGPPRAAPPTDAVREQPGEQQRRGGERGIPRVAEADEAPRHRRREAEGAVELERVAHHHVDDEHRHQARRARPSPRRGHRRPSDRPTYRYTTPSAIDATTRNAQYAPTPTSWNGNSRARYTAGR